MLRVEGEEEGADVGPDLGNADTRVPPHHGLPVRPHQELFKVPLDVVGLHRLPEESPIWVAQAVSHWRAGALQDKDGF